MQDKFKTEEYTKIQKKKFVTINMTCILFPQE